MRKKLKVFLKNNEGIQSFECVGIIQDNIITYKEENNTLVKLDKTNHTMIRENHQMKMLLSFAEKDAKAIMQIKDIGQELKFRLMVKDRKEEIEYYKIEYSIEEIGDFLYSVKIEV